MGAKTVLNWCQRLAPNFSASPLYGDGKVYFFADDGTTTVVQAGRQFKKAGREQAGQRIQSQPRRQRQAGLICERKGALYRVEE